MSTVDLVFYGIIGLILCFAGYRLSVRLFGLLVFVALASFAYHFVTTNYNLELIWNIAIALTAGAIGALLSIKLKRLLFMVIGFILGFSFSLNTLPSGLVYTIISIVIGLVVGSFSNRLANYVLTLALSYFGAVYILQVVGNFTNITAYYTYILIGVTALGFLSQLGSINSSTRI